MNDTAVPWVEGLTIGGVLREVARRRQDADAQVFPQFQVRRSYRQFDDEVDSAARALLALGVGRGDHVGLWATNWPHWPVVQFATARIGAVLVTINPAYRAHELAYVLKQSDCQLLFLIDKFKRSDYFAMLHEAAPGLAAARRGELNLADFPRLRHIVSLAAGALPEMWGWDKFLGQGAGVPSEQLDACAAQLCPNDPINIQYTSGTTGFPKGAMLSHRNLLLNAFYVGACQQFSEQDRLCTPVPFYHCFGCVLGVLCAAVYGAALIVPHEYFLPEATLEAIEAERATALYGVPTMYIAMLDNPTRPERRLGSLRTGIMSGSPCPLEVMQRVLKEMGVADITIAYGETEASPVITQTRCDDPVELRVKTVGRPIPGIEVKIVDPASGEPLGPNQQGELCTRGHLVMLGYYNMPEQTARAIDAEGWLHTGDLATRLDNGCYRITGRIKDLVIRGGENIYPREIEECLYTHPAVQDVAVVGVPDTRYIEELAAWIRLKPGATATEDEIRRYCQAHLAHFKSPRYVRFVTEFPQTVTGKIQKFKIREVMIAELGLGAAAEREMA